MTSSPPAVARARLLLVLAPLALLLYLVARQERGAARTSAAPALAAVAGVESPLLGGLGGLGYAGRPAREDNVRDAVPEGVETARSFLAQHYGAAWAETEARLVAAGVKLDIPYVHHPWEEAEPLIREQYRLLDEERAGIIERRLGWPAEPTLEWVRSEFATGRTYPLSEEDLPVLRDLVADLNLELLGKLELWTASIDVLLQERFANGQFVRLPYTNKGLDEPQGFYAKAVGGLGWATAIALSREDYPEMVALENELASLRRQRYERVVRFLHGRIPH